MNLAASTQSVGRDIQKRLSDAKAGVEGLSTTWQGSGIPGEVGITMENPKGGAEQAALLTEAIEYAHERAEMAIRAALDYAVAAAVWGWRDGTRDIVDTGALRNSLTFASTSNGLEFWYTAPYANLVHYGGYVRPYGNPKIDAVYIPGRPWVDAVMTGGGPVDPLNLDAIYDEAISRAFR